MNQTWSSSIPGLHILREFIDHDHVVSESNELNNEATRAILVGQIPDFHVDSLAASNMSPILNQVITLTTTITNQGDLASDAVLRWYSQLGNDNEQLIHQEPFHLAGLETTTRELDWFVTDPNATIIVRVEGADPVEFDFTDNEKSMTLDPIIFSLVVTDVVCADLTMGTISVNVNGGFPPYFIQWSNGYTGTSINVPSGVYSMTLTDALGATRIGQDTVMDLALPATWYQDLDNDGYGNPNVHQYLCEAPPGYVGTGTDCNDNFATVYPEAPEIADGKDNDCDGLIDEGLNTLDVDAGDCKVVYYGYSPSQCVNITVAASGGASPYTYHWNTGPNTATINVCPTVTTLYHVTVTDANGFTAQDHVTVQVIDIRCGNNNNKVLVCHLPPGNPQNVQSICIAPSAVPAHLDHGDFLGVCEVTDPCEIIPDPMQGILNVEETEEELHDELVEEVLADPWSDQSIDLYPNPADEELEIDLPGVEDDFVLEVFDVSGKRVLEHQLKSGKDTINTSTIPEGMYVVRIRSAARTVTKGIVIMH
jgi:hypothetical protein